jgi:cob(I)alamin adenosyltransferase
VISLDEEGETLPTHDDEEKLTVLRKPAADGFEAINRRDAVVLEGDEQLTDFIAKVGRSAARRAERERD